MSEKNIKLVIAEKPSVAQSIAKVIGADKREDGYLEGKNNRTVRVLKTPKTESSIRKVYIPSSVAVLLAELCEEQNETIEALGDMYENYNLVMATSYGLPLGESYLRDKMQEVIDREGLPDVVFHSLRHPYVKPTTKKFITFFEVFRAAS